MEFCQLNGPCLSGQITRKAYVKKNGKGPETLPPLKNEFHLRSFGYSYKKTPKARQEALRKAAQSVGDTLAVYRRLNLARNKQGDENIRKIMGDDVEYMKNYYRRTKKQSGGHDETIIVLPEEEYDEALYQPINRFQDESIFVLPEEQWDEALHGGNDEEDDDVNIIDLPEDIEFSETVENKIICNSDNCEIRESHTVDDKNITYYTLTEKDAAEVLELDNVFMDFDRTEEDVLKNLQMNKGLLIGIRDENSLQGYCQFAPLENKEVEIKWFCANKMFGEALYIFMEKYFQGKKYTRITIKFSLDGRHAIQRINFWNRIYFRTYKINTANNVIYMDKLI
uniref:N-acetyltransferase domain-containing protein n=1 Tax=viral metagenome TaxID=1070528 RepID=A0A6C0CA95_9ZZZZ